MHPELAGTRGGIYLESMSDLSFRISATARGSGPSREGAISVDGLSVPFASPSSMGGSGAGTSPETLLLSAVTACYSLTLLAILKKRQLPITELRVATEGIVSGHPRELKYEKVIVNPVFAGAPAGQIEQYRSAAIEAHDRCFIGQTVSRGGVAYEVGRVEVA